MAYPPEPYAGPSDDDPARVIALAALCPDAAGAEQCLVAAASAAGVVRLFDPATRSYQDGEIDAGDGTVRALTAWTTPTGTRLALGFADGTIRLWDPASGTTANDTVHSGQSEIRAMAGVLGAESTPVIAFADSEPLQVALWNPAGGPPSRIALEPRPNEATSAATSDDAPADDAAAADSGVDDADSGNADSGNAGSGDEGSGSVAGADAAPADTSAGDTAAGDAAAGGGDAGDAAAGLVGAMAVLPASSAGASGAGTSGAGVSSARAANAGAAEARARLAVVTGDGVIRLVDPVAGTTVGRSSSPVSGSGVRAMVAVHTATGAPALAVAGRDKDIHIWDPATDTVIATIVTQGPIWAMAALATPVGSPDRIAISHQAGVEIITLDWRVAKPQKHKQHKQHKQHKHLDEDDIEKIKEIFENIRDLIESFKKPEKPPIKVPPEEPEIKPLPGENVAARVAAVAGAGLVVLGSFLPAVSGQDAAALHHGFTPLPSGLSAVGSRLGIAGGDGLIILVLGLLALGAAVIGIVDRGLRFSRRALTWCLVTSGGLALAWAVVGMADVRGYARPDGAPLAVSTGIGLQTVVVGAAIVLVSALLTAQNVRRDLTATARHVDELWHVRFLEAFEMQQRLLRRITKRLGSHHPDVAIEWLRLSTMHAGENHSAGALGAFERYVRAVDHIAEKSPKGAAELLRRGEEFIRSRASIDNVPPAVYMRRRILVAVRAEDPRLPRLQAVLQAFEAPEPIETQTLRPAALPAGPPVPKRRLPGGQLRKQGVFFRLGPHPGWFAAAVGLWLAGGLILVGRDFVLRHDWNEGAAQHARYSDSQLSQVTIASPGIYHLWIEQPATLFDHASKPPLPAVKIADAAGKDVPVDTDPDGAADYSTSVSGAMIVGRDVGAAQLAPGVYSLKLEGRATGEIKVALGPGFGLDVEMSWLIFGVLVSLAGVGLAFLRRKVEDGFAEDVLLQLKRTTGPSSKGSDKGATAMGLVFLGELFVVCCGGLTYADYLAQSSPLRSLFLVAQDSPGRAIVVNATVAVVGALLLYLITYYSPLWRSFIWRAILLGPLLISIPVALAAIDVHTMQLLVLTLMT